MTEERPRGARRDTISPYAKIGDDEIRKYGELKTDERRQDIFPPVASIQQIVRTNPQDEHIHRRAREGRSSELGVPEAHIPEALTCHRFS
jgi:hypothetical protein